MTVYNLNLDLGFLSDEEAHAVVEVLERDKRLKEIEKERIGRLLEQRGDRKSVLGWPENLRNQQTNNISVHPSQAPHSTNIEQQTVRSKPIKGRDDGSGRHTTLRARLSSMFSLRVPLRGSRDPGGKNNSHSHNNGNVHSSGGQSCEDKSTEAKHVEEQIGELAEEPNKEAHTEEELTKEVHTEEELTKEVHTEEELTKEVHTEEELTKEVHTEEELTKEVHTEEELTKEVHTEEELTKEVHTEEELTKEVHTEEAHREKELTEGPAKENPIEDHSVESNKVIGPAAFPEGETEKRRTDLLETGGKQESSTGQNQREDQESSGVTGPASAPQSASHPPVKHENPTSNPRKGEHIQPSAELKTSIPFSPNRNIRSCPIRPHHSDISSPFLVPQEQSLPRTDTVESLSPEVTNIPLHSPHRPPKLQSSILKRSQLQKASGRAVTPARHLSLLKPWSVESPGMFSLLRPSSSTTLPTSHYVETQAEASGLSSNLTSVLPSNLSSDLPSNLPSGLPSSSGHRESPVTLRQHISSSHLTLFPASDLQCFPPQSLNRILPQTTLSHYPLGYKTRLSSSLIFNSLPMSKNTLDTATQSPKYLNRSKSLDTHLTKAVSMDTAGDNHSPYSPPSNTRWMSSSERIHMLAKQHNLAAQVGLSKAISQQRILQTNASVQSNNQRMFKHHAYDSGVYDTGPSLAVKTHSLSSLNSRASRGLQSHLHRPPVSPDHMTDLTRSYGGTHSAPADTKQLMIGDKIKVTGSEIIDSEIHNISEFKCQTSNKDLFASQIRKNCLGLPAQDATLISDRTEKEPTGYRSNRKVDHILNRLRMIFSSKRIEEKSVLFGRKGKTVPSTLEGASVISENRRTGKRSPEVKEVLKPIDLQRNVAGHLRQQNRGCNGLTISTVKLASKNAQLDIHDKERNTISTEKNGNPSLSKEELSITNHPHSPYFSSQSHKDSGSSRTSHFSLNTKNEDVFSSSMGKDSRSDRSRTACFKPTQLSYSNNSPTTTDFGLKHGRSISVTNIYSNRTSRNRRISTGTDMAPTRYLRSLEDIRGPGDLDRTPRTLSRAFSSTQKTYFSLIKTDSILSPKSLTLPLRFNESSTLPTEILNSLITDQNLQVIQGPMELFPISSSSLSDFEEYDSDTTTDGEYYLSSDDWEKESIL
ncbi:uncharacterized protein LOC115154774 isoform X2 [Salmo trutta]|uniref:uncharacterized protein LOC115154774 isoform X2 n=1 Tax=Salmo trutta TaxID=8032 RepID=UPI0011313D06|nr:uncharacterized protein LOC115154774 isoform X2 [Salmo trutta]